MVGAVAEVVEPAFCVGKETAGGSTHAIAIGAFDDVGCGREGSSADRVVLGAGPETKNDEIGFVGLPPERIADVLLRNPENRRDGRFRISDFGMWPYFAPNLASLGRSFEGLLPRVIKFVRYCGVSTRFGRRMHDEKGVVAEVMKSFRQQTKVAMPKELVSADGEVGVEKDFQAVSLDRKGGMTEGA